MKAFNKFNIISYYYYLIFLLYNYINKSLRVIFLEIKINYSTYKETRRYV